MQSQGIDRGEQSMVVLTDEQRDFWRGMLAEGGLTTIPRWTLDPHPGLDEHYENIPHGLVGTLRRLADGLGTTLDVLLLAVHAKVLATLVGEREVVTGYAAAPGVPAAAVPIDDRAVLLAGAPDSRGPSGAGNAPARGAGRVLGSPRRTLPRAGPRPTAL